jgi:hypothetical protein
MKSTATTIIILTCLPALLATLGCEAPSPEAELITILPKDAASNVPDEIAELARTDHVALLKKALEAYRDMPVKDYTCTFVKQEVMNGSLRKEQAMKVKFRDEPFSLAIAWTKNPPPGDAMIFVRGKYKNAQGRSRMLVRPASPFLQMLTGGSVLRLPDSPDAMREALRPCTMFGFSNGLKNLLGVYEAARAKNECKEKYLGLTEVGGRKCLVLVRTLPDKKGYPAAKTFICIDVETLMPLRMLGYGWKKGKDGKPNFLCNYVYRDVKFNVGLGDKDFTPDANGIKPPKDAKKKKSKPKIEPKDQG